MMRLTQGRKAFRFGDAVEAPLFLGFTLALVWWIAAKMLLFQSLQYTADIFLHLHASRSLVENGKLLDWIPFNTTLLALHNNFTVALMFPFTMIVNASGFFVITIAVHGAVLWFLFRARKVDTILKVVVAALLAGSVGYYLFDNVIYGWNPELLFAPFAALAGLGLTEKRRGVTLIGVLGVFLTREEGAIMLWAIHVLWRTGQWWAEPNPTRSGSKVVLSLLRITLLWIAVFAISMGFLFWVASVSHSGFQASSRLGAHLSILWNQPGALQASGREFLFIGLICLVPFLAVPELAKFFPLFLVALLPLYSVMVVASAGYPGGVATFEGVWWPPRFTMIWGVLMGSVLVLGNGRSDGALEQVFGSSRTRQLAGYLLLIVAVSVLQGWVLTAHRGYSFADRLLPGRIRATSVLRYFQHEEIRFVDCLSKQLPRRTKLMVSGMLAARFDRMTILFGSTPSWTQSRGFVCDTNQRVPFHYQCAENAETRVAQRTWESVRIGSVMAGGEPQIAEIANSCLRPSS